MNILSMKKAGLAGIICVTAAVSATAQAACKFEPGYSSVDGQTVTFDNVVVQRDAPIGTILANVKIDSFKERPIFIKCDYESEFKVRWETQNMVVLPITGEQLFSVGIEGVALRLHTDTSFTGAFPRERVSKGCEGNTIWTGFCGYNFGFSRFELVKTASVTGSGRLSIPGKFGAAIKGRGWMYRFGFGSSTITTLACSVSDKLIQVPMGSVSTSEFTHVGSSLNEKNFNILLNCDAGTKVKLTLDGTPHDSNAPGVLALDPTANETVASGVGLQLLHKGAPVTFDTPITIGTVSSSGSYPIPLVARYYQTNAKVTAGQANSSATFTMTYN